MSYGQHSRVGEQLEYERAVGYREPQRDGGFPISRENVKGGRMTNDEIMAGVDQSQVERIKRTAHNEVTRWLRDGTIVCRFRETDIVTIYPDGEFGVNTGGWNTMSTRRHIVDFLTSHNIPVTLWGDKKAGGNLLRDLRRDNVREIKFRNRVSVFTDGSWQADA